MDIELKKKIINYLYDNVHLYTYKFKKIERNEDITLINSKYYLTANYCGIPIFLIFLKMNNNYNCYSIDRRTLSFEKSKINISNVRITQINAHVDIKLYDGSIFDCSIIDETSDIIITDVFYYCSKNMLSHNYKNKMLLIKNLKIKIENINIYISSSFEIDNYKDLFNEYLKMNSKKMNIRGIAFYPEKSGTKLIYVFNKQDLAIKDEIINSKDDKKLIINDKQTINQDGYITNNKLPMKEITCFNLKDITTQDDIFLNFEVVKKSIPDVYELYAYYDDNLIKKKIGISYVHSYDLTLKCKKIFENTNTQILKCKFNKNNKKWIIIDKTTENISILNKNKYLNYEIIKINYETNYT
jgi:hypothetical protein